jgi:hypothetical protein
MEVLKPDNFLDWAVLRGIVRDGEYPDSDDLVFDSGPGESRYWGYPADASSVPYFVRSLLGVVGPDETWWLYPTRGHWSLGGDSESWPESRVWTTSIHALGVPHGLVGAVGGLSLESDVLLSLLFLQVALGPSAHIDTYAVPESGHALLRFEHHDVVSARFRDPAQLAAAVVAMDGAGYPLPSRPPDATFKPTSWMGPDGPGDGA